MFSAPAAWGYDYDADDNGCPDADAMSLALADIEAIEVPTSQRTPELDGVDCTDLIHPNPDPLGEELPPRWCEPSLAFVPPDLDDPAYPRDNLVLFLVGGGNRTQQITYIPQTAAYAGYRTINLSWDNEASQNFMQRCGSGGGSCSSECLFDVVQEYLKGVDVPPAPGDADDTYTPHPMHSIEGKLKLALEHLHVRDTNLHGTPEQGWDAYCTTDSVRWDKVEVSGFSMGAQMASFISYREPGAEAAPNSIGFFGIDLGVPACEYHPQWSPDPSEEHFPEVLHDHAYLPPCGEAGACPSDNRFVVLHDDGFMEDEVTPGITLLELADLGFAQEGIFPAAATPTPFGGTPVDAAIDADDLLDSQGRLDQARYGNLFETAVTPFGGGAHGSMAEDDKLGRFGLVPTTDQENATNASEYYLLPLYLQAFCEIRE